MSKIKAIEEFDNPSKTGQYKSYSSYQQTSRDWLKVPEHWDVRRLKFCAQLNPSKKEVAHLDPQTEVTFLPMENVSEEGKINYEETEKIEELIDGYTYFQENDVLVAKITPCFENGKGTLAQDLKNSLGFGTTEFVVLRPKTLLNNKFLYYVTASSMFRTVGEAQMNGAAGQKRVPDQFFQNFLQFIPPKEEQEAIVEFLDSETEKIDQLIEQKKSLIELLEEKREAIIKNAVSNGIKPSNEMKDSGVTWLGTIPEEWEVRQLRYLGDIDTGNKDTKDKEENGKYPFFVRSQTKEKINSYSYDGEAVLTAGDGVGVGKVFHYTDGKFDYHQRVYKISNFDEDIDGKFFFYYLKANLKMEIFKNNAKSTVDSLRMPMFKSFPVAFGNLAAQKEIVNYLDNQNKNLDKLIDRIEQGIELLKEYRKALITKTVTGQIDVRGEV